MFEQRNIITAVEIGTSKICVLTGKVTDDDKITVIGHGEVNTEIAVSKGEIVDVNRTLELLARAFEEADEGSGGEINNSRLLVVTVTGCDIDFFQGVGTVFINNEDHTIRDSHLEESLENAQVKPLPMNRMPINTFDAYFLLDGNRRVRNPLEQIAHKLEAYVHVIHGNTNRVENFISAVRNAGFERKIEPVFSGIASLYGLLTEEEKENGALLVDMGAGVTEYAAVYNLGVLASGMLPIGFEHLANDLSLGLDLHISVCRKLLRDGVISEHIQAGKGFIEQKTAIGKIRKIPVSSFEKIIDLRLREVFQIIHEHIVEQGIFRNLGSGGIITGGASLLPRTAGIFREIFQFPVRVGKPFDAGGAVTGLENPRYSTVWGALKYGEEIDRIRRQKLNRGFLGAVSEGFDGFVDWLWDRLVEVKKSIKF